MERRIGRINASEVAVAEIMICFLPAEFSQMAVDRGYRLNRGMDYKVKVKVNFACVQGNESRQAVAGSTFSSSTSWMTIGGVPPVRCR